MRLHLLGICGTFMSGVAMLAKQSGFAVSGSDLNVYPPMSTQLKEQGIEIMSGFVPEHVQNADCVIVGNVIKRGNPAMEFVLNERIPYQSGPEWLAQNILQKKWVLAIAGTHGKTTTTSLLTWVLECAGLAPGYLIGGVPENFGVSARLGTSEYFVIEADEYDSAFFDKRSKFIHYRPKSLILNNLEYDHADIFPNLEAIKLQFHYLIRTIAQNGQIICEQQDENLAEVLERACYTPLSYFNGDKGFRAELQSSDGSQFKVYHKESLLGDVSWSLLGQHNVSNALAVLAAVQVLNIPFAVYRKALQTFKNVKRRLEMKGKVKEIAVYDDFAHHPTAIASTLAGLRAKIGADQRMIAVVEFGSYTMRSGVHKDRLKDAFKLADMIVCKKPEIEWGLTQILSDFDQATRIYDDVDSIIKNLTPHLQAGDHVIVMSNSGFDGIHQKLLHAIEQKTH